MSDNEIPKDEIVVQVKMKDGQIEIHFGKGYNHQNIGHALRLCGLHLVRLIVGANVKAKESNIVKPNAVKGSFIQGIRNRLK